MPLEVLISALITLLVVVDPIGLVPSYLAITHGLPQRARRSVALHATLIAAAILVGSALVGDWLLRTLSIGLPAFRIAGGLMLFSIASEMVFGVRTGRQSQQAEQAVEEHVRNIAAFPLALPLMAGPGAITATILLASRSGRQYAPCDSARRHRDRSGALPGRLCARGANRQAARRYREYCRFASARCSACGASGAIRRRRRTRRTGWLVIARE
jgi:MarC family membrane protein